MEFDIARMDWEYIRLHCEKLKKQPAVKNSVWFFAV